MQKIILVDKNNKEIGSEEKIKTHKEGLLHRAFSIFVFNAKGELLLQQRSKNKYHSGGLWSNTVCSHPRVGENYDQAIHRRMKEEVGFDCELKKVSSFIYRAELEGGLVENEHDTIFIGKYNGIIKPNPKEVMAYKWISLSKLKKDIKKNPKNYSSWLGIALDNINFFKEYEAKNSNNLGSC